ncbi:hypothetical protein ABBQ32_010865 [Trebouxia sp. C0010 RCD-2024]
MVFGYCFRNRRHVPAAATSAKCRRRGCHKSAQNATAQRPLLDVWQALVDLCTESGRQQADSIIVSFFFADSPTGMFKQLPTDVPAQQALLSSVDRQLPAEAQQACEGPDEGIPLAELHSALKAQTLPQVSQSRRRRRSDRRFFEALEGCAGNAGLGPRPQYYFSIDSRSALVVTFGHLYPDKASKAAQHDVEASVMVAIREKYTSQLVAIDPQRLGTATAAYDLHFTEQFLQLKQSLRDKGELPIDFNGQQKFVRTSERNSKSSPMFAQIVVKQLDLRWRVQGATSALLRAAGYEREVAVKTEFAGELPAHLSFWGGGAMGRSDTIVAQVTAPATDPSLRKLPRSIQFQGHTVSISVSRSLHSKTEQRNSHDSETLLKQQRRRAKQARRKVRRQRRALPLARDAADIDVTVAKGETSTSGHEHVCGAGAIPSAGKKRDLESGSDSEPVVAGDTDALAIVPLTPDDDHGDSVRRSSREHKKPKPYFELASTSLSVPKAKQGLKSGFFK